MKQKIEEAKGKINRYYSDFIEKCLEVHGIDLTTIISDCVTAGYESRSDEIIELRRKLDSIEEMNKKPKNQVYIPHQDKWNEHFPTPGKPNPNYYTDSGATFNKHLRTQNKLKSKQK